MGQYRIEISPNNRATCKNKDCKDKAIKIVKGEPRFGTFVDINGSQSWAYKHWGCVTPAQIKNIKDSIDGDLDLFDGYDEVPEEIQDKIRRALDQGHVDDADWAGDVELNRPGMKGMHKRTPKKKDKDESDDLPAQDSVKAASGKKRSRAKKEDEAGEVPAPKKTKATTTTKKRGAKSEDEDDDKPITKKAKPAVRKGKKAAAQGEDAGADGSSEKRRSSRAQAKPPPQEESASPDGSEDEVSLPKGRVRKTAPAEAEIKAGNPKRGRKAVEAESKDADVDCPEEAIGDTGAKPKRKTKKLNGAKGAALKSPTTEEPPTQGGKKQRATDATEKASKNAPRKAKAKKTK